MKLDFYKYEGTGNDFVIIDNRELTFQKNDKTLIQRFICFCVDSKPLPCWR